MPDLPEVEHARGLFQRWPRGAHITAVAGELRLELRRIDRDVGVHLVPIAHRHGVVLRGEPDVLVGRRAVDGAAFEHLHLAAGILHDDQTARGPRLELGAIGRVPIDTNGRDWPPVSWHTPLSVFFV